MRREPVDQPDEPKPVAQLVFQYRYEIEFSERDGRRGGGVGIDVEICGVGRRRDDRDSDIGGKSAGIITGFQRIETIGDIDRMAVDGLVGRDEPPGEPSASSPPNCPESTKSSEMRSGAAPVMY